ncbi:hypothetical protein CDL15_Pgr027518 [Punica granatum]|uniref:Uncharacterized protein n=1 Tax=Punica granatum TaxID=22663 RepID=A0A218XJT1_PUNGR|nr:hypothetical protein CDL15_Pgr027518 [Punica granatum]
MWIGNQSLNNRRKRSWRNGNHMRRGVKINRDAAFEVGTSEAGIMVTASRLEGTDSWGVAKTVEASSVKGPHISSDQFGKKVSNS